MDRCAVDFTEANFVNQNAYNEQRTDISCHSPVANIYDLNLV